MRKFFVPMIAVAALALSMGCEKIPMEQPGASASKDAASQTAQGTQAPVEATTPGTVSTISIHAEKGAVPFSVEIADTKETREKGLVGRESIPENGGMWFVIPPEELGQGGFYMKDTLIPLDWIFVDKDMKVIYIKPDNKPNDMDVFAPKAADQTPIVYSYMLEVRAGTAAKHGIKVGDAVEKRIGPQ